MAVYYSQYSYVFVISTCSYSGGIMSYYRVILAALERLKYLSYFIYDIVNHYSCIFCLHPLVLIISSVS